MNTNLYWIKLHWMTDPYSQGYIGMTKQHIITRFKAHKRQAKNCNLRYDLMRTLYKAILSYGDDLICEPLHEGLTNKEARIKEREYRDNWKIGWNICKGGGGGAPPTAEGKIKISIANSGKRPNAITRAKMSKSQMGNQNCLGFKHTDETRAKMSGKKGFRHSEETKINMSIKHMGKMGHKHTDEARAKMSVSQLLRRNK